MKKQQIYDRENRDLDNRTQQEKNMIIAFVKFKIPSDLDDNILKEKFLETAPIYKDTEGLIRKNYISDTEKNIAGGVYCFDTRENAEKWFDAERIAWITERYSAPEIQYFENPVVVDNKINEVVSQFFDKTLGKNFNTLDGKD